MSERRLHVITATVNPVKTMQWWLSWRKRSRLDWDGHVVLNGAHDPALAVESLLRLAKGGTIIHSREILGVVPAFHKVLQQIDSGAYDIIALLHDDLEILEDGWDEKLMEAFNDPNLGLLGFGGALGVGRAKMYDEPFDPMTLARHDFISNMKDAELHGRRVTVPTEVAVLDGFSLIGRVWLLEGAFRMLRDREVIHHAYDVAVGCHVRRQGYKTLMLPVACHHAGGQTAVGEAAYQEWAQRLHGGDQAVWRHAHRQVWEEYKDVMPFRI